MGFAWHKLIPRNTIVACPPACDTTYETNAVFDDNPITLCPPYDPFDPFGGPQGCALYTGLTTQYGGAACGFKDVLEFTFRENPGGPLEMRLNVPLLCSGNNNPDFGDFRLETLNGCEMGNVSISEQYYYYRTPNSPNATPTQIASTKLCLKYNPFTIADRFMIISARNRYKYGGWHVDPSCPTGNADEYGPPILWDDPTVDGDPPLGCGIKQFEESLGREWPLPNSVLNLPLFGADEAPLSVPQPPLKCGDSACANGDCFAVAPNGGSGHYLPQAIDGLGPVGNGRGYYSFQCFNPMGYTTAFVRTGTDFQKKPKSIPTCSIWSFANAMWKRSWKAGWYSNDQENPSSSEEQNNGNPVYPAYLALLQADPLGLTNAAALTAGESNVTAYLRGLKEGIEAHTVGSDQAVIMPNVFYWDKDAMLAEENNINKWKHLYFIGNANVIFDTQCMVGTFQPTVPYSQQDKYGFVIHLDEVAHDPEYGSTGNARLISFYGCNKDEPFNLFSKANFGIQTMDCALTETKAGGSYYTYCDKCNNEDLSGLGTIGGKVTQKCVHIGHSSRCDLQGGVQGL
jgi:hypothetical protein